MKKLFFFAAALVAAMTVNAQTYSFAGIKASDITTDGTIGTYTMDGVDIPSVSQPDGVDINAKIASIPNLVINFTRSAGKSKNNILKFAEDYMQADGKNVILTFSNVAIGNNIELLVSAKGSTNAIFTAFDGCIGEDATVSKAATTAEYVKVTFQAIAGTVRIKETNGGYRIISATIGNGGTGVENVAAQAQKAVKVIENGQLYIIKNGVKYNALGAKVAE